MVTVAKQHKKFSRFFKSRNKEACYFKAGRFREGIFLEIVKPVNLPKKKSFLSVRRQGRVLCGQGLTANHTNRDDEHIFMFQTTSVAISIE